MTISQAGSLHRRIFKDESESVTAPESLQSVDKIDLRVFILGYSALSLMDHLQILSEGARCFAVLGALWESGLVPFLDLEHMVYIRRLCFCVAAVWSIFNGSVSSQNTLSKSEKHPPTLAEVIWHQERKVQPKRRKSIWSLIPPVIC